MKYIICFLIICFFSIVLRGQEQNITPFLKKIESGDIQEVKTHLTKLKSSYPNDPSVKFLEAVLTEDGSTANAIYIDIYTNHAGSNYADASLYRIFSYYYASGIYGKANEIKNLLLRKYPASPYIKALNRNIPDSENEIVGEPVSEQAPNILNNDSNNVNNIIYRFTIQAGAFLNNNNAKQLKSRFIEAGFTSDVFPKEIGGSIFNVVTVGKFKDKNEADVFLAKLKNEFNISGRIISLEQ